MLSFSIAGCHDSLYVVRFWWVSLYHGDLLVNVPMLTVPMFSTDTCVALSVKTRINK